MLRLISALIHMPYFTLMDIFHRIHDAVSYYKLHNFRQADLALLRAYAFKNPYAMCRRFFNKLKDDNKENTMQTIYGETFLITFELIAKRAQITEHDIVYDLGCGRGRGCFFLNSLTGAQVIGIDINPLFIQTAQNIASKVASKNIQFRQESIFDTDLSHATVLYFYGVAFNDTATLGLIEKFTQLPAGILIFCVGFSLNDYYDEPLFREADQFEAFYLWGKTQIWVCETMGPNQNQDQNQELGEKIVSEFLENS